MKKEAPILTIPPGQAVFENRLQGFTKYRYMVKDQSISERPDKFTTLISNTSWLERVVV